MHPGSSRDIVCHYSRTGLLVSFSPIVTCGEVGNGRTGPRRPAARTAAGARIGQRCSSRSGEKCRSRNKAVPVRSVCLHQQSRASAIPWFQGRGGEAFWTPAEEVFVSSDSQEGPVSIAYAWNCLLK
eukprot:8503066-Pyramimonas_sp.AAC.3